MTFNVTNIAFILSYIAYTQPNAQTLTLSAHHIGAFTGT
ncbi:hypothetical protein SAMN05216490_2336 [Mucilaginibacter mallensis]|uniref:Uncharacterized protein n=1 Tax=Mucilaginibacter mallensis TaxID=652787 RepID=A0A1H1X1G6_MUCMA|nr:hypothetical protein SAMN05216490_2336 [Mucilaginibacter mallensis]